MTEAELLIEEIKLTLYVMPKAGSSGVEFLLDDTDLPNDCKKIGKALKCTKKKRYLLEFTLEPLEGLALVFDHADPFTAQSGAKCPPDSGPLPPAFTDPTRSDRIFSVEYKPTDDVYSYALKVSDGSATYEFDPIIINRG